MTLTVQKKIKIQSINKNIKGDNINIIKNVIP